MTGGALELLNWEANPADLYPHPERLQQNGYNYSPAFELVVGWGRHLSFEQFTAIWRALLLVTLVWLAGPFTVFLLFLLAGLMHAARSFAPQADGRLQRQREKSAGARDRSEGANHIMEGCVDRGDDGGARGDWSAGANERSNDLPESAGPRREPGRSRSARRTAR